MVIWFAPGPSAIRMSCVVPRVCAGAMDVAGAVLLFKGTAATADSTPMTAAESTATDQVSEPTLASSEWITWLASARSGARPHTRDLTLAGPKAPFLPVDTVPL